MKQKSMELFLWIWTSMFLCCINTGLHGEGKDMELQIFLTKTEIILYEPVWIIYTIKNNTSSMQRTTASFISNDGRMKLNILNIAHNEEDREKQKSSGFHADSFFIPYIQLPPGTAFIGEIGISSRVEKVGKYEIQLEVDWFTQYESWKNGDISRVISKKPILSNVVNLVVNYPLNEQDILAVKLLEAEGRKIETWKKILTDYPESTYAKYARYYTSKISDYKEIIKQDPTFELNDYLLYKLAKFYYVTGKDELAKKELEEALQTYPTSIWKNIMTQLLQKIIDPNNPYQPKLVEYPKPVEDFLRGKTKGKQTK